MTDSRHGAHAPRTNPLGLSNRSKVCSFCDATLTPGEPVWKWRAADGSQDCATSPTRQHEPWGSF